MTRQRRITAINAVTATTVSSKFWVGGAKRIGFLFRRANHSAGSTAFTVKGSLDPFENANGTGVDAYGNRLGGPGVTMTALNMLVSNATNSNVQNRTRVTSTTLSADGDAFAWLEPDMLVNWLEITATETTDGTHTAIIVIEEDVDQQPNSY